MTDQTTAVASTLVFVDTETTGLHPDRRAWDIAVIVRRPGKPDHERQWFIQAEYLDLGNADPFGLRVGHFYQRHPQFTGELETQSAWGLLHREDDVLREVETLTRGAHLVGCVPNFDADVLGARMRANGILPSWHYHLIDCEALAVGWLSYKAKAIRDADPAVRLEPWPSLPWKSEDLSRALGVEPPSGEVRHTAIGDARWAMRMYDAVMGTGPVAS